ncbi:MAG: AAA family ATPase, partial [Candidatus Omnitrophota bacterium]
MLGQTVANRYKIAEEIIQDSLASLYKAQDLRDNKSVLITALSEKSLPRPLEVQLRFKRAAEQASRLNHPNLLQVTSIVESDNQIYLIYEDFYSQTLSNYLNQPQNLNQPLNTDRAVDLILQVSSALSVAHEQNLLHQAIKPQNILIDQQTGQTSQAKLFNFGYSILQDISRITEKEDIISTFGYLSPESSGILRKPVDSRSDIYSIGILLYQLLTGRLPYIADDISSLIHQHIATKPNPPSKLNNTIPPVLDNIVLRLIAKEPQERYQGLSGLIFDLMEYQSQKAQGKELVDFEIARFDKLREISFSTKLIGRDKELNQLNELLNKTKQGQGSLVFVFGEPGIGKSRLVDELRGSIHSLNGLFCGGKCYQYEFRTPYKVFAEAIDAYIEKVKRLSTQEQEAHIKRIKEALGELGGEVVKIAPTLTELIGQPPKLVELEPEKEKIRFLITVTSFLSSLAEAESPLLIFLDDLQWADDGSLEILERLAEKLQNTSTTVIISYRDTEVDPTHPLAQLIKKLKEQQTPLSEIPVRFFSLEETSQMISQIIMEKEDVVISLAQELNERTKGNPFFTLELLHSLVDTKVIYLKNDRYAYDLEKLKTASLPTTIVDAVLKRMNDLSEENLQIISYASVMGKEIEFELLTELTNKSPDIIVNSLEDGIRNQLLFRDLTGRENIFFMHDRIREAFYQRVPEAEREPLHKHIAEVLEEQNKNNLDSIMYDLAYHFTQAKIEEKALQYSIPAAMKAKSSYANILAINLFNTARQILERKERTKSNEYIDVLENLGELYRPAGKLDESLKVLKSCESLVSNEDMLRKARIVSKIAQTLSEAGKLEESAQVLMEGLSLLKVKFPRTISGILLGIPKVFIIQMLHACMPRIFIRQKTRDDIVALTVSKLLVRLCYAYIFINILGFFYCYLRLMNLLEKKVGPSVELATAYTNGGTVWVTIPWLYRGIRDAGLGMRMAKDLDDKIREGCAHCMSGASYYLVNKPKESLELVQKGISLLKSIGEYWELGVGCAFRDYNNCVLGRLKEGAEDNKDFVETAESFKVWQTMIWAYFLEGKIHSLIGDVNEKIIEHIQEAEKIRQNIREKMHVIYIPAVLGFAYFRISEYDKAVESMDRSIKLFYENFISKPAWTMDMFCMGSEIYAAKILNTPNISTADRRKYIRKMRFCSIQALFWGRWCIVFLGWSLQVNATYLWLTGHKRRAVRTWDKALNWLRTNKNNPGGDKYRIAYILLEEAKFLLTDNPQDKKALGNLL